MAFRVHKFLRNTMMRDLLYSFLKSSFLKNHIQLKVPLEDVSRQCHSCNRPTLKAALCICIYRRNQTSRPSIIKSMYKSNRKSKRMQRNISHS